MIMTISEIIVRMAAAMTIQTGSIMGNIREIWIMMPGNADENQRLGGVFEQEGNTPSRPSPLPLSFSASYFMPDTNEQCHYNNPSACPAAWGKYPIALTAVFGAC
jgi:hypothetical protein